jgi:hypothetical protein
MPPSLVNASIICVATSNWCVSRKRGKDQNNMTPDLVTYLSFDGQCEAAFNRYEKILGGKIVMMVHYADAPADAGVLQTPESAGRIMHARLQIADRL